MRHRVAHRKLGRVTEHRIALLRNQAQALLLHEHIQTTVPKAKELRPFVERLITVAKRGLASGEPTKTEFARRLVSRDLSNEAVVEKLFDSIAPRFGARPGGYTRMLKVGARRGDSADMAYVELVGSEYNPNIDKAAAEAAPARRAGMSGRLRAAAARLRGKGEASPGAETEGGEEKPARKRTPRKK
jgi:large subunit ribosomal protein L17